MDMVHKSYEQSEWRRMFRLCGTLSLVAGFILLITGVIAAFERVEETGALSYSPIHGRWMSLNVGSIPLLRPAAGAVCIVVGTILRSMGARRAPRTAVIQPIMSRPPLEEPAARTIIKVRCLKCDHLNEEKACFCQQCGGAMRPGK